MFGYFVRVDQDDPYPELAQKAWSPEHVMVKMHTLD